MQAHDPTPRGALDSASVSGSRNARLFTPRALAAAAAGLALAAALLSPGARMAARAAMSFVSSSLGPAGGVPEGSALLTVESNVPAEVYLGDEHLGATPLVDRPVISGPLKLRLVNGSLGVERSVALRVLPGEVVRRRENFAMGKVRFHAEPECEVFVRGQWIAHAPGPALDLCEGAYEAQCRNEPLGLSARAQFTVPAGPGAPVDVRFSPKPATAVP